MLIRALASLFRLVTRLLQPMGLASAVPVPLDPVERLQQHGSGLPMMLEFARIGW
jgi:hypothetical protein